MTRSKYPTIMIEEWDWREVQKGLFWPHDLSGVILFRWKVKISPYHVNVLFELYNLDTLSMPPFTKVSNNHLFPQLRGNHTLIVSAKNKCKKLPPIFEVDPFLNLFTYPTIDSLWFQIWIKNFQIFIVGLLKFLICVCYVSSFDCTPRWPKPY